MSCPQAYFSYFPLKPMQQRVRFPLTIHQEKRIFNNSFEAEQESENFRAKIQKLEVELEKTKDEREKFRKALLKEKRPFVSSRKPFRELDVDRKSHKKAEVKSWMSSQFQKLPSEWEVKQVKMTIGEEAYTANFEDELHVNTHPQQNRAVVLQALKAKDEGDISDYAYNELKQVPGCCLPSLCSIIKERSLLNSIIPIKAFQDHTLKGCTRSIYNILKYMFGLEEFKAFFGSSENNLITLRFSGDGRRTTKKLGSVMTTFSLPVENLNKRSPDKEYCISVYDGKEDYDILSEVLDDIYNEMSELQKKTKIDEKEFQIDWLLCADWKFMAVIMGINSPCSNYFCIWCECCKSLIRDFSIKDWPVTRTIEQCLQYLQSQETKGVKHAPLLNIPFKKVIVDTLHLKLRIRGKLLNQVACWAIEQKKKDEMVKAMESIGVKFLFYDKQDDSGKTTTKWSSLDCDDLETVIKHLDLKAFLNNMSNKHKTSIDCLTKTQLVLACDKYGLTSKGTKDFLRSNLKVYLTTNNIQFQASSVQNCSNKLLDVELLQKVWQDFEVLASALTSNQDDKSYLPADQFREAARQWANIFRLATFDEDVIPYIHVLVYHVPQFLQLYGQIHQFNCQMVEKKNHMQNRTYHRGSQKGGRNTNYTVQIMEKENRKMFYRVNSIQRQKRKYVKKG